MEAYGFARWWAEWEAAGAVDDRPTAWQEALAQFGLVSLKTVCDAIQARSAGRTAKDMARKLIVGSLTHDTAYGSALMAADAASGWADQFLAPVGADAPLYTGTADTATINGGVVLVLGPATSGEGSSVGCLWFGDKD